MKDILVMFGVMELNYLNIIKSQFDIDPVITDEIDLDEYKFIFFIPKEGIHPLTGERLTYATNVGPLRVNKHSGEHKFITALDFSFKYGDRKELINHFEKFKLTYEEKIKIIRVRKEVYWEDFVELFEEYHKVSLFENADMFSKNPLSIEFKDLTELGENTLIPFLKDIGATYNRSSDNHIVVELKIN